MDGVWGTGGVMSEEGLTTIAFGFKSVLISPSTLAISL